MDNVLCNLTVRGLSRCGARNKYQILTGSDLSQMVTDSLSHDALYTIAYGRFADALAD